MEWFKQQQAQIEALRAKEQQENPEPMDWSLDGVSMTHWEAMQVGIPTYGHNGKKDWTTTEIQTVKAQQEVEWNQQQEELEKLIGDPVLTPRKDEESPFPNPYWDAVKVIPGSDLEYKYGEVWAPDQFQTRKMLRAARRGDRSEPADSRKTLVGKYSWTITAPESVQFVADWAGPHGLVEIGAGTGYWARCLSYLGVDTLAFDIHPPASEKNTWHSARRPTEDGGWEVTGFGVEHYPIRKGGTAQARRYPHRTLFLSWPPYGGGWGDERPTEEENLSYSALSRYRGNRLIYIGESAGGCTGTHNFHHLLSTEWHEVAVHRPVQWFGLHDWIFVYERGAETDAEV